MVIWEDDGYYDENATVSFEIEEDFENLKNKLCESMKNGLIRELAIDDTTYNKIETTDKSIKVYSQKSGYGMFSRDADEEGERIVVEDKRIFLEEYRISPTVISDWEDSYADKEEYEVVDYLVIKPKENGGCRVFGSDLVAGLKQFKGIFAGVRNEITYVPETLAVTNSDGCTKKYEDTKLREDEKNKISGAEEYKNKIRSKINYTVDGDIFKVLRTIDPSGHTDVNRVKAAVDSIDARMGGVRRNIFCYEGVIPIRSYLYSKAPIDSEEYRTSIPKHWSVEDANKYFNMRYEGYPVSERMFNSYIKSGEKEFASFLKSVVTEFVRNRKKGMSREGSLDSALTLIDAKNLIRRSITKGMTADIKSGIAKTKESGYGYVSESDRRRGQKSRLNIKNMKDAKDVLAK